MIERRAWSAVPVGAFVADPAGAPWRFDGPSIMGGALVTDGSGRQALLPVEPYDLVPMYVQPQTEAEEALSAAFPLLERIGEQES